MTNQAILRNFRVLDFTRVLAGPFATRILADFGAEVIKVQPPNTPVDEDEFAQGYYRMWNRNKLSITLNPDNPEGLALAKRLVAVSDAVAENFSPRVMANWGLDYENLKKVKPDIIMLSMSVMGNSGPWRNYTGFAPAVQAFSGITRLTSFPDKPPAGLGFSYADHVAGLYGAQALLGALEQRNKTGAGQFIDLSEVETMSSLLGDAILDYTANGKEIKPSGNSSPEAAPHNVYPCKGEDRWCAIAVFTDEEWRSFQQALGNPQWAKADKFVTLNDRLANLAELDKFVAEWTKGHTAEAVMTLLQSHGVAAGVVQNAADLAGNAQLKARGFLVKNNKNTLDASPIKMSRNKAGYDREAPSPDRDNAFVYGQLLGLAEPEIAALHRNGVI